MADEMEDFAALFEASLKAKPLREGQTVDGTIVGLGPEVAFVDVGGKGEATIDIAELKDEHGRIEVSVGDRVHALVVSTSGGVRLSRRLAQGAATARQLEDAFRTGLPVEGRVEQVVKGGLEIRIARQRAFCPISQIDIVRTEDPSVHVGKTYTFRITEYSEGGRNLVVSRRAILEEAQRARADEVRRTLVPGAVVTGHVASVRDFGAFVDLGGGVQGLLHVSEMGWSRVSDPARILAPGDEITVKVLQVDEAKEKISLGLKQLSADPWATAAEKYHVGDIVNGEVTRLAAFGAFVELEPGIEALAHASTFPPEGRRDAWTTQVPVGVRAPFEVVSVDVEKKRIGVALVPEGSSRRGDAPADNASEGFGTLADRLRGALKPKPRTFRPLGWALALALAFVVQPQSSAQQPARPAAMPAGSLDVAPGPAEVSSAEGTVRLFNAAVSETWRASGGRLSAIAFDDREDGRKLPLPASVFELVLADGTVLHSSDMRLASGPHVEVLRGDRGASRFAERLGGRQVSAELESANPPLRVAWRGVLRDGSNYVRQVVTIESAGADAHVSEVRMLDLDLPDARVVGTVKGSPIVSGDIFLGFEHPLSESRVEAGHAVAALRRGVPVRAGSPVTYSSVIGVARPGQLRREFLRYVERERAHPYRPFLHYNSWYDLGYFNKYDEAGALDRIKTFGEQLHEKRGVTLDSFLFDDGWDDSASLWHFHSGFPNGFTPLRKAAARYGAAPGVWLSPWGGYGQPRQERLQHGREAGYETNKGGFALSGPKYFALFEDTCLRFIREYGVNQFKIDGTGNVNSVFPGSRFDSDFAAAISLIADLRAAKPDLYVNLTTGTYPSPFWLQVADSIWRGGEDHSFAGVGSFRQQWITYRDADTYAGIVRKGPLFPLNSLMLHGLIYAQHAKHLDTDPNGDFPSEVRDYFGTGTQLQEMYITPSLLTPADWDAIAQAAKWSRANAATLVDTHWVGGDPAALQVYGWAAWSPAKGILTLRNPSDKPQSFSVDVQRAFELPHGAATTYRMRNPFDESAATVELRAGEPHTFELKPFEVLTLEGGGQH